MFQVFDLSLSFYLMSKNGSLFDIYSIFFSRFHKIKTRT